MNLQISIKLIKFRSSFSGVSGAWLKTFEIPIYGFILIAIYGPLCHICYYYISVKFRLNFYPVQETLGDQRSKHYEQMAPKALDQLQKDRQSRLQVTTSDYE